MPEALENASGAIVGRPKMVTAYVGLGSNLGDPVKTLQEAMTALDRLQNVATLQCSSLYRSRPMVKPAEKRQQRHISSRWCTRQPDYINAVAMIETTQSPMQLLRRLQGLEKRFGRLRTGVQWSSRTLDLDLLMYGDQCIRLPRLVVPHPGMVSRAFVLLPLAEVAADDLVVPGQGMLADMLADIEDKTLEKLVE